MTAAALRRTALAGSADVSVLIAAGIAGLLGFFLSWQKIAQRLRARPAVERVMLWGLIAASTVAVLTTIGIVMSVMFESLHFFQMVPPAGFFFGTVWDPRFAAAGAGASAGQFGLLPLLWGTVFISLVAMSVAVPVGLLAAIYMSEYAGPRMRAVAKPVLEVLAGIPTIVYGFFALVTFGPFLRDIGQMVGLTISANSVLSAGVVMGVMIIPFVSSLSDDIINAVPNALREGSYALGATQSETIRRVVIPAALPGIVGAILLAGSRAIGETMIVVLAAGIAANLTLNPLEPVTTITVKIVSQLTGDLEFNSPQTLVAFALGLTLFVITLGLNVIALYVVRTYREQYE
jgi:phosphate transport system permease protein